MHSWARAVTLAALLALATAAGARRSDQDFEFDDDAVSPSCTLTHDVYIARPYFMRRVRPSWDVL